MFDLEVCTDFLLLEWVISNLNGVQVKFESRVHEFEGIDRKLAWMENDICPVGNVPKVSSGAFVFPPNEFGDLENNRPYHQPNN